MEEIKRLRTKLPESRRVRGLEYGSIVTTPVCNFYYVRPRRRHGGKWGLAQITPARDELPDTGSDRSIMRAIREEWENED